MNFRHKVNRSVMVNINDNILDRIEYQAKKFYGVDISFLTDWQVADLAQHILNNSLKDNIDKDQINFDKLFDVGKKDA